jgi:hypothetical protein
MLRILPFAFAIDQTGQKLQNAKFTKSKQNKFCAQFNESKS